MSNDHNQSEFSFVKAFSRLTRIFANSKLQSFIMFNVSKMIADKFSNLTASRSSSEKQKTVKAEKAFKGMLSFLLHINCACASFVFHC